MKKILLLFVIASFIGCGPSKAELEAAARKAMLDAQQDTATGTPAVVSTDKGKINIEKIAQIIKPDGQGGGSIRFLTIDGHEYIQWYTSDGNLGVAMCHNEGCSNEIHTAK